MFSQGYGSQMGFMPQMYQATPQEQMSGKGKAAMVEPAFDEAAFERAFDMAAQESMGREEEEEQFHDSHESQMETMTAEQQAMEAAAEKAALDFINSNPTLPEQPALFQPDPSTTFMPEDTQTNDPHPPPHDDEELARTAGRLLDSVSDNQSQKFQQSSFLALMRQLRDHEVRVEGDKIVDSEGRAHTPQPPPAPSTLEEDVSTSVARPQHPETAKAD